MDFKQLLRFQSYSGRLVFKKNKILKIKNKTILTIKKKFNLYRLNKKFEVKHELIDFVEVPGSHTGEVLAKVFKNSLNFYGLLDKVNKNINLLIK